MNVRFFFGTKEQYLNMDTPRDEYGLYFCVDTCELFRGDVCYTNAIKKVAALPGLDSAADGVIYCLEGGDAYYLNEARDGWEQLSFSMPEGYATEEYVDQKIENFWGEKDVYILDGGEIA